MDAQPNIKYKSKGFTLIELVIVIAVLGILAGIAIPRFLDSRASAAGSKLLADLRTIDSACAMYQIKNSDTPTMAKLVEAGILAANAVPPTGTMLIVNNSGESVKYEASAQEYGVDENGRATYTSDKLSAGKVEQYLALGNGSASYNEIVRLAQAAIAAGEKSGGNIDQSLVGKFPAVEDSLLKTLFGESYSSALQWRVDANYNNSKILYFATDNTSFNGGWNASIVVVDGILYKSSDGTAKLISGFIKETNTVNLLLDKGFVKVGPISGF